MNVCAIIQARMSSQRLPGKTLMDVEGKPMLQHIYERVQESCLVESVVIATSVMKSDDPIAQFCNDLDYAIYRGSEKNVLERYYEAASHYDADHIVRITGDEPLIDPSTIDKIVSTHLSGGYEYTRTLIDENNPNSYPRGLDVDVFSFDVLEHVYNTAHSDYEREHVTIYIYEHPDQFNIKIMDAYCYFRRPKYRLCVDFAEDLELIRKIYSLLYRSDKIIPIEHVIRLLDSDDSLSSINIHINQKNPHKI